MKGLSIFGYIFVLFSSVALADMTSIDDQDLADVTGQSGIYISGEISINENGGPLANSYFGACSDSTKVCGARIAFTNEANSGWWVIDNIRGSVSFEGLTLQVREINSGFGGDGALFNRDVIEIGLPGELIWDDFQFELKAATADRPSAAGNQQADLFGIDIRGKSVLQGNLLVFPTD